MYIKCIINECHNKYLSKGYCSQHYYRWKVTGDPLTPYKIIMSNISSEERIKLFKEKHTIICRTCKKEKDANEFQYDKKTIIKKRYQCDTCSVLTHTIAKFKKIDQNFDYQKIYKIQKGKCAICKKHEKTKTKKNLTVDHDHKTNKIRGLLCHKCNSFLGYINDNILILQSAVKYLTKQVDNSNITHSFEVLNQT